jgi:hypothetical protein
MTTWRFYFNLIDVERKMVGHVNHISWATHWMEWQMWRNC